MIEFGPALTQLVLAAIVTGVPCASRGSASRGSVLKRCIIIAFKVAATVATRRRSRAELFNFP